MNFKKISTLITAVVSTFLISTTVLASNEINVKVNGDIIDFADQKAQIVDGRTLVPLRGVFDSMGFTVTWDNATRSAKISNSLKDITMTENIKKVVANTKTIEIDVAPQIINSRLMIPLRAVAESIDAQVEWDATTRTVSIYYMKADGVDESIKYVGMDEQQYLKTIISLKDELRDVTKSVSDAVLTVVANLGDFYDAADGKVTEEEYEAIEAKLKQLEEIVAPDSLLKVDSCVKDYTNLINSLISFSKNKNPKNVFDKNNDEFMSEIQYYQDSLDKINSDFGNYLLEYFTENKVFWEDIYGEYVLDLLKY